MNKKTIVWLLALVTWCGFSNAVHAEDFGIIMDVEGEAVIQRNDKELSADIGMNVEIGDTISISEKGAVVLVSYDTCEEWNAEGAGTVLVIDGKLILNGEVIVPNRELPVCYSPKEFATGKSSVIGGFVLRNSQNDPLAHLREEYKAGKSSNSSLITLIMYDLNNGQVERSRHYFMTLQSRVPDSSFVKSLAREFEENKN